MTCASISPSPLARRTSGCYGWSSAAQGAGMSAGMSSNPAYWTARETAQALAERRISARELLGQVIAHIEALDGPINAVVVRDFDRARDAARAADAALARGERRPLLGVAMTVKESHDVAGLPTTWGLPDFRGWRPEEDGTAIARLKQAGAIIIGKTNVPTALGDWQSANGIYGFTRNPWDKARSPGGSSGGGAAASRTSGNPAPVPTSIATTGSTPRPSFGPHTTTCGQAISWAAPAPSRNSWRRTSTSHRRAIRFASCVS